MDYQNYETYHFLNSHAFNVATCSEERDYPNHWHTYGEIILVGDKGPNVYRVNRTVYELEPGDIVLIWPLEQHEIIDADRKNAIIVQFTSTFAEALFDIQRIIHYFHDLHVIKASEHPGLAEKICGLVRQMRDVYASDKRNRESQGCMLIIQLMLLLDENRRELKDGDKAEEAEKVTEDTKKRIIEVTEFIKNNLATEDLGQAAMSQRAGISSEHFSRCFKELTGINYSRWLNIIRVNKAISLFGEEHMKLTEIAMMSGFQSISSFNRVFRELKGISPGEYRNMKG